MYFSSNLPSIQNHDSPLWAHLKTSIRTCMDISSEALGFAVASLALRIIFPPFSLPMAGIAGGILSTRLVIKGLRPYNQLPLMNLTYEACQLRERYPKLQTIAFVFTMGMSFLSQTLALASGIAIGIYGAIVLDVDRYKTMQNADRKALLEKGLQ